MKIRNCSNDSWVGGFVSSEEGSSRGKFVSTGTFLEGHGARICGEGQKVILLLELADLFPPTNRNTFLPIQPPGNIKQWKGRQTSKYQEVDIESARRRRAPEGNFNFKFPLSFMNIGDIVHPVAVQVCGKKRALFTLQREGVLDRTLDGIRSFRRGKPGRAKKIGQAT